MACKDFQPDFFNNVAAVAIVLILTKVVMHRSRRGYRGGLLSFVIVLVHVLTVLAAAGAIWISLWATDVCNMDLEWHKNAWYFLGAATALLLIDLMIEDVIGACVRRRSGAEK